MSSDPLSQIKSTVELDARIRFLTLCVYVLMKDKLHELDRSTAETLIESLLKSWKNNCLADYSKSFDSIDAVDELNKLLSDIEKSFEALLASANKRDK